MLRRIASPASNGILLLLGLVLLRVVCAPNPGKDENLILNYSNFRGNDNCLPQDVDLLESIAEEASARLAKCNLTLTSRTYTKLSDSDAKVSSLKLDFGKSELIPGYYCSEPSSNVTSNGFVILWPSPLATGRFESNANNCKSFECKGNLKLELGPFASGFVARAIRRGSNDPSLTKLHVGLLMEPQAAAIAFGKRNVIYVSKEDEELQISDQSLQYKLAHWLLYEYDQELSKLLKSIGSCLAGVDGEYEKVIRSSTFEAGHSAIVAKLG